MKYNYITIVLLALTPILHSQIVTIPDANFKNALVNDLVVDTNFDNIPDDDVDTNNDGEIQLSEAEAVYPSLYLADKGIISLVGISSFTQLNKLYCAGNQLVDLDVSQNIHLVRLECENNQLTSLNVSQNLDLEYLHCDRNFLSSLDVTQNPNLFWLNCYLNELTDLNLSQNPNLWVLRCFYNELTSLDLSQNTNLYMLVCGANQLSSLDVSQNLNLGHLSCGLNNLTQLDVTQNLNLSKLYISDTQLTSIDVSSNINLKTLFCENNQLTSLDLTNNPNLEGLLCRNNQLNYLNVKNNSNEILTKLWATGNPNLSCINVDDVIYANNQICDINGFTGWCKDSNTQYGDNCILGAEDFSNSQIVLHPIPVKETLHLKYSNSKNLKSVEIFNLSGRLLLFEDKSFNEFDLSNIKPGVLLVRIKTDKKFFVKQIIKY